MSSQWQHLPQLHGGLGQNLEAPAHEQIPRQRKQASVQSGSTSICVQRWTLTPGLWGASCLVGLEPTNNSRLQPLGLLSPGVTTKFNPNSATFWTRECTNHLVLRLSPSSITNTSHNCCKGYRRYRMWQSQPGVWPRRGP